MITVLAGGVGAARFLAGLVEVVDASEVTAIVNVGDDTELHGLHVSPDIDTVTYTLAGAVNAETGWGLAGETWQAMDALERLGGPTWFRLGDRDLGHPPLPDGPPGRGRDAGRRSPPSSHGRGACGCASCRSPTTGCARWSPCPARARCRSSTTSSGSATTVPVSAVRFDGAAERRAGSRCPRGHHRCRRVVIAPSNPIVSIGPLLAVPGVPRRHRRPARRARSPCPRSSPEPPSRVPPPG